MAVLMVTVFFSITCNYLTQDKYQNGLGIPHWLQTEVKYNNSHAVLKILHMAVAYAMVTVFPMAGKNQTQENYQKVLELGCGIPHGYSTSYVR